MNSQCVSKLLDARNQWLTTGSNFGNLVYFKFTCEDREQLVTEPNKFVGSVVLLCFQDIKVHKRITFCSVHVSGHI